MLKPRAGQAVEKHGLPRVRYRTAKLQVGKVPRLTPEEDVCGSGEREGEMIVTA
jgi:hypothetical protein